MIGPVPLQADIEPLVDAVPLQAWQLLFLAGFVASVVALRRIARPGGAWARTLRSRLVLGVPWGTLLSIGFVLCMYLFLQGGVVDLHRPVTFAFQASGYANPLGIVTSSFAHQNFSHLFGNLVGALVFGSIAEYGVSHYATARGESSFGSLRTNPLARPVAFFLGVVVAGVVLSAFTWGPVIGFSGVVFGLAGFALVVHPLATMLGLLATEADLHWLVYNSIMNPVSSIGPSPSRGEPWFAGIAIQGHLFGFLLGVLLAALLLRRRSDEPSVALIWVGALLFGAAQGLWTAYWQLGTDSFLLFRSLGVTFVAVVAALVVATVAGSDRPVLSGLLDSEWVPSRRKTAAGILVLGVVFMSMVGLFLNLAAVQGTDLPNDPIEIRDYQVGYVENSTNQQYSIVGLPGLGSVDEVEASGVIVSSQRRNIWQVTHTEGDLAFRNFARVLVGGPGWREEILVTRTGWKVVGDETTYWVRLHTSAERRTVFTSGPATAEVLIANRTISMRTTEEDFQILVGMDNRTVGRAALPEPGGNVTAGGIRFERTGDRLIANYNGTRVQVASKREPGREQLQN